MNLPPYDFGPRQVVAEAPPIDLWKLQTSGYPGRPDFLLRMPNPLLLNRAYTSDFHRRNNPPLFYPLRDAARPNFATAKDLGPNRNSNRSRSGSHAWYRRQIH